MNPFGIFCVRVSMNSFFFFYVQANYHIQVRPVLIHIGLVQPHDFFKIVLRQMRCVWCIVVFFQKRIVFFIHDIGTTDAVLDGGRETDQGGGFLHACLIDKVIFWIGDHTRSIWGRDVGSDLGTGSDGSMSGRDGSLQIMLKTRR